MRGAIYVSPAPVNVSSKIDAEIYRRNLRQYDAAAIFLAGGSGTSTSDFRSPSLVLDTGAAAANTERFQHETADHSASAPRDIWTNDADVTAGTLRNIWNHDHVMQCLAMVSLTAGISATQRFGISLNDHNGTRPWPTISNNPVVRLSCNMNVPQWELMVQNGNNVTPETVTVLAGVNVPNLSGEAIHLKLIYKAGSYIAAEINGIEGARVTVGLPPANPPITTGLRFGPGLFVYGGTLVTGRLAVVFYGIRFETYGMP